jgi:hypothetical protein
LVLGSRTFRLIPETALEHLLNDDLDDFVELRSKAIIDNIRELTIGRK